MELIKELKYSKIIKSAIKKLNIDVNKSNPMYT